MKILQVIPYFTPKRGGDVNVCYNISKELSKLGHEVTILTTDFEFSQDYANKIQKEGVKIFKFSCINLALFLFSPKMKKWLNKNLACFDIIHMHNFRSYQNNIVYKYALKHKVPYVLQAHGSTPLIMEKQNLKRLYDFFWGDKLIVNSSRLIAVSKTELEQYNQFQIRENHVVIIPNGIDAEKFEIKSSYGTFRKLNDIETKQMILFLGRLHKIKGLKFLINAFKEVLKDINDITLVIAGPDEGYRNELEELSKSLKISNYVKFIDYVKDVNEAYTDADVLIYPAIYEIFGLVPFEAIMCGTPIIVTDNCGCGDLVKKSSSGYLIKYGDESKLCETLKYVLKNPESAQKKVKNGKKYISINLVWEKVVNEVEKVYEDCICDF